MILIDLMYIWRLIDQCRLRYFHISATYNSKVEKSDISFLWRKKACEPKIRYECMIWRRRMWSVPVCNTLTETNWILILTLSQEYQTNLFVRSSVYKTFDTIPDLRILEQRCYIDENYSVKYKILWNRFNSFLVSQLHEDRRLEVRFCHEILVVMTIRMKIWAAIFSSDDITYGWRFRNHEFDHDIILELDETRVWILMTWSTHVRLRRI